MEVSLEETSQSDGGVDKASEKCGGGEAESQAVNKLCQFLKRQQEVVYK